MLLNDKSPNSIHYMDNYHKGQFAAAIENSFLFLFIFLISFVRLIQANVQISEHDLTH